MAARYWSVFYLAMAFNAVAVAQDGQQRLTTGDDEFSGPSTPATPGQITIFDKPSILCANRRGQTTTKLDVPMNTCLSADFTLDSNVFLSSPGYCPGGSRRPYVALFPTADCTGDGAHPTWWDRPGGMGYTGYCLSELVWNFGDIPRPEGQWSMIFHCGDEHAEHNDTIKIYLPEAPVEEKPKPRPRRKEASVSDSACFIPGIGMAGAPRFIFQKPRADTCRDVKPKHRLKIYRNALCDNGTEALFARFSGAGCEGEPVVLEEVGEEMMATNFDDSCIEMGGEEESSYAFWCTGMLEQPQKAQSKTKSGTKSDARAWVLPTSLGAFGLAVCFVAGW